MATLDRRRLLKRVDKYIILKFLGTYFLCIALIVAISVVFDYNEHIDDLKEAPLKELLFDYYLNFIPFYANQFSSLFVFIAVIFFTSKLAENTEIVAMFSTGLSFKRMLVPYMLSAGIIAVLSFMLSAYIVPRGSVDRIAFDHEYIHNKPYTSASNIQMEVDTGVIAYISRFEDFNKVGYRFCLDKFEDNRLVSHMTARTVRYDTVNAEKYHWIATNYMIRNLGEDVEEVFQGETLDTIVRFEPADFMIEKHQQETMTSPELRNYINRQKQRGVGNTVREFEIEYHKRIAMTFASFILTLIGVSLASRKRKGGMGLYLGLGIGLSFGYIMFQTVSSTFAVTGSMSAFWAEWLPNLVFIPIAVYLYIKAPK